jgi:predicted 3-demethylubiquinone-9 3-methyltransferase (glyoxalase superfamily)
VTTCLTFNDQCEEAVKLYVSLFPNSRIKSLVRSDADGPIPKGKVMAATFTLNGRPYTAFDGGEHFAFAQGMSLMATCKTQKEIDRLWEKLGQGGQPGPCGWLTDRFGVSWQVIPDSLGKMLTDEKGGDTGKAMRAMLGMTKLDIKALEQAYKSRKPARRGKR